MLDPGDTPDPRDPPRPAALNYARVEFPGVAGQRKRARVRRWTRGIAIAVGVHLALFASAVGAGAAVQFQSHPLTSVWASVRRANLMSAYARQSASHTSAWLSVRVVLLVASALLWFAILLAHLSWDEWVWRPARIAIWLYLAATAAFALPSLLVIVFWMMSAVFASRFVR